MVTYSAVATLHAYLVSSPLATEQKSSSTEQPIWAVHAEREGGGVGVSLGWRIGLIASGGEGVWRRERDGEEGGSIDCVLKAAGWEGMVVGACLRRVSFGSTASISGPQRVKNAY